MDEAGKGAGACALIVMDLNLTILQTTAMIESPFSPAVDAGADNGACACNVHVLNELGLHARPAAVLAQEAQKFRADIQLRMEDQEVDAKSILDILSLAASRGSELELHASGADAREAVDRLSHCFRTKFGEEK